MHIRRALRSPVRLAAKLGLKLGEVPVTIVDVSTGGARLSLSPSITTIAVGDRLGIEVVGTTLGAEVRWVLGHQAGVAFDRQLPEELVDRICSGAASSVQAHRRPARRKPAGGIALN